MKAANCAYLESRNLPGMIRLAIIAALGAMMLTCPRLYAAETTVEKEMKPSPEIASSTVGSGERYRTIVERRSEGELSADDLRQASLLSSQVLLHLRDASLLLTDDQGDMARPELEKAQALVRVVRELLPVTTVTTMVKNVEGQEVYRSERKVQDDQIPIYERAGALEVVEPIIEASEKEAALKGLKLADADLIHTMVLMDLSFIERKIKRALELTAKPEDAAMELLSAQTRGVRFVAHKEDGPLLNVQHALRLAERMVQEKKFEGARANLETAKLGLEAYRALVGEAAVDSVADLEQEIQKLSTDLKRAGTAEKIAGFWDTVVGWFQRETGQAHQTASNDSEASSQS